MSAAIAYVALVVAVAVAKWADRQTTGTAMQEWRDRW